jgi:hypothetical protein
MKKILTGFAFATLICATPSLGLWATAAQANSVQSGATGVPMVSSVAPEMGPASGGTSVTIMGSNFSGATTVNFGGANSPQFNVISNTQLTAETPPQDTQVAALDGGEVNVSVTGPLGTSSETDSSTFCYTQDGFCLGAPDGPIGPVPPPPAHGYWLVGSDGGIFSFGSATFEGSASGYHLQRPVVGITQTPDRQGYWLVASDGGIFSFGDTTFYGSIPSLGLSPAASGAAHSLNAPMVGMVPSVDDKGYFLVGADGGVFAFGDATFAGSCPGIGGCSGAAVAVMPDASGKGYWVVTATGHVYSFGDALYYGAPSPQNASVTSAVSTPNGLGYWILSANGAVFGFGDAYVYGSPLGSTGGFNPATAIFTTSDGYGCWVASAIGSVYAYGVAPYDGGMNGTHLNGPIIAATGS